MSEAGKRRSELFRGHSLLGPSSGRGDQVPKLLLNRLQFGEHRCKLDGGIAEVLVAEQRLSLVIKRGGRGEIGRWPRRLFNRRQRRQDRFDLGAAVQRLTPLHAQRALRPLAVAAEYVLGRCFRGERRRGSAQGGGQQQAADEPSAVPVVQQRHDQCACGN